MIFLQVNNFYKSVKYQLDQTHLDMFLSALSIVLTIMIVVAILDRNRWKRRFKQGEPLNKEDQKWIDGQIEATPEKLPEDETLNLKKVDSAVNKMIQDRPPVMPFFEEFGKPTPQGMSVISHEDPAAKAFVETKDNPKNLIATAENDELLLSPEDKEVIDSYYESEAVKDLKNNP